MASQPNNLATTLLSTQGMSLSPIFIPSAPMRCCDLLPLIHVLCMFTFNPIHVPACHTISGHISWATGVDWFTGGGFATFVTETEQLYPLTSALPHRSPPLPLSQTIRPLLEQCNARSLAFGDGARRREALEAGGWGPTCCGLLNAWLSTSARLISRPCPRPRSQSPTTHPPPLHSLFNS